MPQFKYKFGSTKKFKSIDIQKSDLDDMILKSVTEITSEKVSEVIYNDIGAEVMLENGEIIEIKIDWEEFKIVGFVC